MVMTLIVVIRVYQSITYLTPVSISIILGVIYGKLIADNVKQSLQLNQHTIIANELSNQPGLNCAEITYVRQKNNLDHN